MTVKELINILHRYPMDADVRIEDNKLQVEASPDTDHEEWEPDMYDFGTCDITDCY